MTPKNLAIRTSKQAGKLLLNYFRQLKPGQINNKSHHELVTIADFAAEEVILSGIKKYFPQHRILSEEKGWLGPKNSDYLWLIDPLDGTTNFVMGNPLFAVSIALYYQQEPLLGVVNVPFMDEIFVAEKGQGAYLNNKKISVSNKSKRRDSILTFCYGYSTEAHRRVIKIFSSLKSRIANFRQLGSAAVEHGFVACGRTEAIMINNANPWDVAAGVLIVREAGGRVTDFIGQEWQLEAKDVLASNGRVHTEILKYLKGI